MYYTTTRGIHVSHHNLEITFQLLVLLELLHFFFRSKPNVDIQKKIILKVLPIIPPLTHSLDKATVPKVHLASLSTIQKAINETNIFYESLLKCSRSHLQPTLNILKFGINEEYTLWMTSQSCRLYKAFKDNLEYLQSTIMDKNILLKHS